MCGLPGSITTELMPRVDVKSIGAGETAGSRMSSRRASSDRRHRSIDRAPVPAPEFCGEFVSPVPT